MGLEVAREWVQRGKIVIEFVYEIEMFALHHFPYFIPSQL